MCNVKKEMKTIHVSKELWLVLNQIKLDKDLATMNDVIEDLIKNNMDNFSKEV